MIKFNKINFYTKKKLDFLPVIGLVYLKIDSPFIEPDQIGFEISGRSQITYARKCDF